MVPNIVLWFGLAIIITLSLDPVPNVILCYVVSYHLHYCNNIVVTTINSKVIPLCTTTFAVPNVIIMIGFILVTAPNVVLLLSWYFYFGLILVMVSNAFPDSLFINLLCAHAVFERFTDRECHNPSGTSDSWGDLLEQSCLGVSNSKKNKNSPLTIDNCSLFNVRFAYSSMTERENL